MGEFFTEILAYPTVIWTVLLSVCLVYWATVILGGLGVDFIDLDLDADGIADGIADGVADGIADGVADGIADAAAEAGAEAAAEGAADGAAEGAEGATKVGALAWIVDAMNLRKAPVTVVISLLVLAAWALSFLGMYYLGDIGIPRFLFGTLVFFVSLFAGAAVASQLVKPLGPLFEEVEATKRADYLGQSAQMTTGKVTATFGQAEIKDGGAGLLVQVRCDDPNDIGRGDEVLLVDFDADREAYIVEGMKALVGDGEGPVETGELSVRKIEQIAALERELAEAAEE